MSTDEKRPQASPTDWPKFEEGNWEDLRFPVQGVNPFNVLNFPDVDNDDGALLFDPDSTEKIFGMAQLPHSWAAGTSVRPHVHWTPTTTHTGNVLWRLEYEVKNVGETFSEFVSVDKLVASSGVIGKHQVAGFGDIDMTGKRESCIMRWKINRIASDENDTYTGDAKLFEFDIHYRIGKTGTEGEFR